MFTKFLFIQYYGTTLSGVSGAEVPTFDFISIQLYESYTHAVYNVSILEMSPQDYLVSFVQNVLNGWDVNFAAISPPVNQVTPSTQGKIKIDSSQLVVGNVKITSFS